MRVKFVDLSRQFKAHEDAYVEILRKVGHSGDFILGKAVSDFESRVAAFCGAKFALGVGNGTDGLVLILKSLDIGPGCEVITAPNSFIASAASIASVGAKIVFADVRDDLNIDPAEIEKRISDKTKAIIAVHLTGRLADMEAICKIAKKRNIFVVEDAAQAIGASYKNKRAGSFGDAAAFSMHPLKNLNVFGDGGFVTTNSSNLYERMKRLRNHGLESRDRCVEWGINSRLDSFQAHIADYNLTKLAAWNQEFRSIADRYRKGLQDCVSVPRDKNYEYSVYHNFVIRVRNRDELKSYLGSCGVETKIHYPILLHKQKPYLDETGNNESFPMAEKISSENLSLPIYPYLKEDEINFVIDRIRSFFRLELLVQRSKFRRLNPNAR